MEIGCGGGVERLPEPLLSLNVRSTSSSFSKDWGEPSSCIMDLRECHPEVSCMLPKCLARLFLGLTECLLYRLVTRAAMSANMVKTR